MTLARIPMPRKMPKPAKRASRWRSQAHCNFIRSHACSVPGCDGRPIEVAHVRMGSGAGIGQKPDDRRTVPLCQHHHSVQHNIGEPSFWRGLDVEQLIADFIADSPKAHEIRAVMRERG